MLFLSSVLQFKYTDKRRIKDSDYTLEQKTIYGITSLEIMTMSPWINQIARTNFGRAYQLEE